ncbi:uncharacterized protein L201_004527 [Kwoniella dendrophila CBS 6074]|uniref:Rrp15p-domain-containing protein n=1 Tax=Kwoniella dendrophila CBS 6074 TaxID=1295534 RepID=A0AAX4JW24_9TREE
MSSLPRLKSALKKTTSHQQVGSSSKAGPSNSKPSSSSALKNIGSSSNNKGKSKGSVTLATKPTRFKGSDLESESEGNASGFEDNSDDDDVDMDMQEEPNTDDEIEKSKQGKESKKSSQKRKRPPTTASDFGNTLTDLLNDPLTQRKSKSKKPKTIDNDDNDDHAATKSSKNKDVIIKPTNNKQQQPILALSAHKPPTKSSVSIEAKARKQLKIEKDEKEDKARIKNIVEGWSNGDGILGGQEFEKSLRKTAQRGVIKLFNAILLASKNSEAAITSLSAQAKVKPEIGKRKEKDNILGRGGQKDDVLTKESFLDMVRKGSSR